MGVFFYFDILIMGHVVVGRDDISVECCSVARDSR